MQHFSFAPVTTNTDNSPMKHTLPITFLSLFALSACQQTSTPKQVAKQYWQALQSGDIASARKLTTMSSQGELDNYLSLADDEKPALNSIKLGKTKTSITTSITDQPNFETILVLEAGKWKIDASRSHPPIPIKTDKPENSDQLSEAIQENLESMDKALEQGTDMLNEFMHEGSKEMSDSLLKGMNNMNEALKKALEKMKQRREQQPPQQPDNDNDGEGLI